MSAGISPSKERKVRIEAYISKQLYDIIEKIAKFYGKSISDVVRDALIHYVCFVVREQLTAIHIAYDLFNEEESGNGE